MSDHPVFAAVKDCGDDPEKIRNFFEMENVRFCHLLIIFNESRRVASNQVLGGPKSLICLKGKSMSPGRETLFSVVSSSNSLVAFSDS